MSESEQENEFGNDESSSDVPMSSLRNGGSEAEESPSKRRRSRAINYAEDDDNAEDEEFDGEDDGRDDDDEDDDDDIPLSALASPSPKKKKTTSKATGSSNGKTKKASKPTQKKAKKTTVASTSASITKSSSSSSNTDNKSASSALYGGENEKGMLIQRLLCRWWYAFEWPDPAAIPTEPPLHYDALDGFPGVYICTEGDEVGAIKDFRDKEKCPSFNNMAKKSSEELKTLLIQALTEQRKQLIEAEGTGTETQKELDSLLKWANKVKSAAADKAAAKILKKFSLE